jgi:PucR family transcriptional regulator, purine catabolism regulatory protein
LAISVKNMMKIGGLSHCRIVAGHMGISKEVKSVTIMEVPDIIRWLKGSELILTSFYPIKDDPDIQRDLVRHLHEANSTAMAIKPHRFVEEIPQIILDEAEKYGFPIIEIPENISYLDILVPVMNAIFDTKVVLQNDLEQANQLLNAISLNTLGIEPFIETLCHLTKNEITIESEYSFIRVGEPSFLFDPLTQKQLQELALIKRPIRLTRRYDIQEVECIVAPILFEGNVYGNITCWGVNVDHLEIDLAILEKASTLLALEFLRLKVKSDVEMEYKNEFLWDLILNDSMSMEELQERGKKHRFFSDKQYICLIVHFIESHKQDDKKLDQMKRIESALHHIQPNAVTGYVRNNLCILYPIGQTENDEIKKQIESLYKQLEQFVGSSMSFRFGVGRYFPGIKGLRNSFHDAEKAIMLGMSLWKDRDILHYNDLGIYLLIAQNQDNELLKRLYKETVYMLVRYDETNNLELIKTMHIYFQHNESLIETANALFVHVNTVKYRVQKIEQLTGHSLHQSEGKLMLHIGLKIYHYLENHDRSGKQKNSER